MVENDFISLYEELSSLNEAIDSFRFATLRSALEKHPEYWADIKRIVKAIGYQND